MADESLSGQRAARSAAVTIAGQGVRVITQLAGLVIIGRLLSPRDYGLIAAVTAFTGVGDLLRDFGLSSAAIQARTVTVQQRSNLFWVNTSIGLVLSLVTVACAGPISSFYNNALLIHIVQFMSIVFLLDGMSTQFRADLVRRLAFKKVVSADVIAQIVGLVVAITLAALGAGYWALVAQVLSQAAVAFVMLFAFDRWIPSRPRRRAGTKQFFSYGINLMFTQLITYASRNVDSVTVGHAFGSRTLGLYNRAFQILTLPLNQLNTPALQVALPILSRLQDDPKRYAAFIVRGQLVMMNISLVLFTTAGALADPLIPMVLGHQWSGAVPIFRILAVGGVFQAAGFAVYWVFLSRGLTRSNLWYALTIRPLLIVLIVVGVVGGVKGVAAGYAVGLIVTWPIGLWWISRVAPDVPTLQMFHSGLRTVIGYGACATVSALVPAHLTHAEWPRLGLGVVLLVVSYATVCAAWPAFRRDAHSVLITARLVRRRPSPAAASTNRSVVHDGSPPVDM